MINDACQTSDPDIYAIGECASWNNRVYGLVAPGYKMAQVAVDHILETENVFEGADLSAKLKLLGVDVGGIGDAHTARRARVATFTSTKAKRSTNASSSAKTTKPCSARYWWAIPAITATCCNWC